MSNPTLVPNKFPTISTPQRLALIGEAPGADEVIAKEPFVGSTGRTLSGIMSKAGLPISCCFKGNICQVRPPDNKLSLFKWNGPEIQHGLSQLHSDLQTFKPNIIVCLGNNPLKAAKDPDTIHPLIPKLYKFKVGKWRGSLFLATSGLFSGSKCISTYHPSAVNRMSELNPYANWDIKRAVNESLFPELSLPKRLLLTEPSYVQTIENLRAIRNNRLPVALDIEGGVGSMSCISFATLANMAFIVPFVTKAGDSYWSEDQEPSIWRELALTLEDPKVPKILQNCLYDTFVLHYSYHIRVRNIIDDTMVKHWALYAEIRKSLAVQASIYTREPYYKFLRLQEEQKQSDEPSEKENLETTEE